MRLLLVSSLFFASLLSAQKTRLSLTFTYTQPYCGGARPSEEMLKEAETPKPYAGRSIVFVSAKGRIDSAGTNEQGLLKVRLKKGDYEFYEAWRYYLYTPHNIPIESFDRKCLKEEWQKPVYRVQIKKRKVQVSLINPIVQFCSWNSPCLISGQVPE